MAIRPWPNICCMWGPGRGFEAFVGHRPVWLAAFKGHVDVVDLLLVSASRDDGKGPSKEDLMPDALFAAVIAGQVPVVRVLCTLGVQLNFFGYPGRSPLFVVASSGMSDLVSLFLAHGADPNFIADQRRSHAPLTAAVIEGHEDIIRIVVGGTANLHRTRALAFAIAQGNRRIAETLLRNGAPPQFHRAAIPTSFEDDHEEWVQPLLAAVQRNSLELVELLVDYGADVNVQCSEYTRTGFAKLFDRVLFWAVEESHEAMVDLLLEHGADPEIADMMGSPPLTYAIESGNQAIVRSLLDHGANTHSAVDHRGKKLVSFRQMSQSIQTQLQEAEEKWASRCQC